MVSWFSKLVVATTVRMPKWFVRWVSRRYVAGDSLDDAVAVMKRLSGEGPVSPLTCWAKRSQAWTKQRSSLRNTSAPCEPSRSTALTPT